MCTTFTKPLQSQAQTFYLQTELLTDIPKIKLIDQGYSKKSLFNIHE